MLPRYKSCCVPTLHLVAAINMKHSTTIKALGGAKIVGQALRARQVDVADVTVRSWSLTGRTIPSKYWAHLAAIAKEMGTEISFELLAEGAAA